MQSKQSSQQNEPLEVSSVDLSEIPQPQLTGHSWRQRGTQLTCESCPFTHSSYIPPEYQLYGIGTDGLPLIRKIEFPSEPPK